MLKEKKLYTFHTQNMAQGVTHLIFKTSCQKKVSKKYLIAVMKTFSVFSFIQLFCCCSGYMYLKLGWECLKTVELFFTAGVFVTFSPALSLMAQMRDFL